MVDAELRPDIDHVAEPLHFADRMVLMAAHAVDSRFRLGLDQSQRWGGPRHSPGAVIINPRVGGPAG